MTICPTCDGAGEVGVRQDYYGNWDTEQCGDCHGEGEIFVPDEPACRICGDEVVACPECDADHQRDAMADR